METALRETGTCGRFQVYHVIFTQLPRFVAVWGVLIMMFGSYNPGWRCKDKVETSGNSLRNGSSQNVAGGFETMNQTFLSPVTRYSLLGNHQNETNLRENDKISGEPTFHQVAKSVNTDLYTDTCDVFKHCDDIEFNPASITIVSEFQLVCDRKWILRVILLVLSVGCVIGALVGGQIGDKFGRKVSLYGGCFITFLFSSFAIFSNDWITYSVCLFFMGVGGNSIISTSVVFSMEYLNSKWRGLFGSIPAWDISLFIFSLATALMKSWVDVHIVTSALCFLGSMGYFVISESARWFIVQERYQEANQVIQKVARINKKPPPSDETLLSLKEETQGNSEKSSRQSRQKSYSYLHLLKSKYLRSLTIKFNIIFLLNHVAYFSLSFGIDSLPGDFYINIIASNVCEILFVILTGPICKRYGRRWGGFAMSFLGGLSCIGIVVSLFVSEGEVQSTAVKACAYIARSCSQAIGVVAMVFMVEHYPTAVRNVAFGLVYSTAGVGGLIAPFLIPDPTRNSFAISFSIMSCAYLLNLWIFLSLSETNRLCLVDRIHDTVQARVVEDESV